jgi:hypothetical protein
MATTSTSITSPVDGSARPRRRDVGVLVFRCSALLIVALLLAGTGGVAHVLAPVTTALLDIPHPELHRWHAVDVAALVSVLMVGSLLVAAWRPRQAIAAVRTIIMIVLVLAASALTMPSPAEALVPAVVVGALVVATFPDRRQLVHVPSLRFRGRLAVVAAAIPTPFLLVNGWENLGRQVGGTDPHALLGHWAGAAALALALLLAGWVAATSVEDARAITTVVVVTHVYLGVAALSLSRYDGAWGRVGALSSLLAATLFVASTRAASRRAEVVPR